MLTFSAGVCLWRRGAWERLCFCGGGVPLLYLYGCPGRDEAVRWDFGISFAVVEGGGRGPISRRLFLTTQTSVVVEGGGVGRIGQLRPIGRRAETKLPSRHPPRLFLLRPACGTPNLPQSAESVVSLRRVARCPSVALHGPLYPHAFLGHHGGLCQWRIEGWGFDIV